MIIFEFLNFIKEFIELILQVYLKKNIF